MPFKTVPPQVDFVAQEREILAFWERTGAFRRLVELRRDAPSWSFIDGPITANNPMGVHHGWGRTYKDLFHRYKAMRGYRTRYQNGFDCQGLWVEVEVEKELGFKAKSDIEKFGVARFVRKCKERVLRYAAVQTSQSIRLGYWMDWNDPDFLRGLADRLAQDPGEVITIQGPDGPVTDSACPMWATLGSTRASCLSAPCGTARIGNTGANGIRRISSPSLFPDSSATGSTACWPWPRCWKRPRPS